MKIVTKLDSFKGDRPFEAWIRRIMINTIIDDYRKNSKEKSIIQFKDIQNYGTENSWVEYNAADLKFEAEELLGFIDRLPTESKKVFVLFAVDGYSHKEIAEQLGISEGGSKSQLSRARNYLQDKIRKLQHPIAHQRIKRLEKHINKIMNLMLETYKDVRSNVAIQEYFQDHTDELKFRK